MNKIALGGRIRRIEIIYPANPAAVGDLVHPVILFCQFCTQKQISVCVSIRVLQVVLRCGVHRAQLASVRK